MTEKNKTGAQKRQVKLSGLISGGVVSASQSEADTQYQKSVEDEGGLPVFAKESSEDIQTNGQRPSETIKLTKRVKLSIIDDSPYQPRLHYDSVEIDNLAHMLAASGLDELPVCRMMPNGRYQLIKGHRRTRAAKSLGWEEIDIEVVDIDDRAAKLSAMISNEGQVSLTDYERGKLYKEAKDSGYAKKQEELAHLFGTQQVLVSLRMAMLELPTSIIEMLEKNPRMFGATTAQDIRKLLKEYPNEIGLIEKAVLRINEGATESSVKAWAQQMLKPKNSPNGAIITDRSGRPIFNAKFHGREFTVKIKDGDVDAKEIEELILATLRQHTEKKSGL